MNREELIEYANKLMGKLEVKSYENMYFVDVRLYHMKIDLDEAIEKSLTKIKDKHKDKVRKELEKEFSDERIGSAFEFFLEHERMSLLDWILGTFIFSSKDEEDENLKKIKDFSEIVKRDTLGFYGRSGGQLCFNIMYDLEAQLEDAIWDLERMEDGEDIEEYIKAIKEVEYNNELIKHIKKEIKQYVKAVNFQEELEFRVEESTETILQEIQEKEDIENAKKLAEKHGYIICRKI